jgi:uncharacterized protein (TIGR00297 family)
MCGALNLMPLLAIPLLTLAYPAGMPELLPRAFIAIGLTAAFALAAWGVRAVTLSGALAGTVVTFVLCLAAGPPALLAVMTVFAMTFLTTRLGYVQKQKIGVAERHDGRRASQVLANLGAAALCAAPILVWPEARRGLLIAMCAALAEAAADTVSSEIGQAFAGAPRLITTLTRVPAGTDGGISVLGSISGIAAAFILTIVCCWTGLVSLHWFRLIVICATAGMFLDSLFGATLEREGLIDNDAVNFAGTSFAAILAASVWLSR